MPSYRSNDVVILIGHLFAHPIVSTPMVHTLLGVANRAARQTIASLEQIDVLRKLEGLAMPEYFAAREILRIEG